MSRIQIELVDIASCLKYRHVHQPLLFYLHKDEVLYEVNANSANWMIAGRKRGHVSLSEEKGKSCFLLLTCFIVKKRNGFLHRNDDMLFLLLACRFKSSNLDTMCPISCGLCTSTSAQFAERGRRKRKKQSTGSSLSVCLASISQFFLLRPCQVVKVVHF